MKCLGRSFHQTNRRRRGLRRSGGRRTSSSEQRRGGTICVRPCSSGPTSLVSTPPTQAAPGSWSRRPRAARRRRRARWGRWGSGNRGGPTPCGNISSCFLSPPRPLRRRYLRLPPPHLAHRSARVAARRAWKLPLIDAHPRTPSPNACPGVGWRTGCGPPMAMLPPLGLPLSPAHHHNRLLHLLRFLPCDNPPKPGQRGWDETPLPQKVHKIIQTSQGMFSFRRLLDALALLFLLLAAMWAAHTHKSLHARRLN